MLGWEFSCVNIPVEEVKSVNRQSKGEVSKTHKKIKQTISFNGRNRNSCPVPLFHSIKIKLQ
jgi:hypothetical protein